MLMGEPGESAIEEACEVMRDLAGFLVRVHERNDLDGPSELLELSTKLVKLANDRCASRSSARLKDIDGRQTVH